MPPFTSPYRSRLAATRLMAERSRVRVSTAMAIASGDSVGLRRVSATRRRGSSTTSAFVSRPSVPPEPKTSSRADTVSQPSASRSSMAGCSTS